MTFDVKEEQLQQQMTSLAAQRQQDHTRSLQSLAAENLQIKEGIESLLNEMKRIQAEKIALQERIKVSSIYFFPNTCSGFFCYF